MQHIVHIFIGDELVSFRDKFAACYRSQNSDDDPSFFTALSMTEKSDGTVCLRCDEKGDEIDTQSFENDANIQTALTNYFESMFQRRVTIAHPGNKSLVIEIWCTLYADNCKDKIRLLIDAIDHCRSNLTSEVVGFTDEAVSCFIPDSSERLSQEKYRATFQTNISALLQIRGKLSALRLIENRNQEGVSLDFSEDSLALVCTEFATIQARNYLSIRETVGNPETPFESFGLSSIKFDRAYFLDYLRTKVLIAKMEEQGIDHPNFNTIVR